MLRDIVHRKGAGGRTMADVHAKHTVVPISSLNFDISLCALYVLSFQKAA